MSFYAVRIGKVPGIFKTWDECKKQVMGVKGAIYKKFTTEVTAQAFIDNKSKTYKKTNTTNKYTQRKKKQPPKKKYTKLPNALYIFTDGSSVGNGSRDSKAGYGIYIPEPKEYTVHMKGTLPDGATNNCAELTAILDALRLHDYNKVKKKSQSSNCPIDDIVIVTDSDYSIKCITQWSTNWVRNGWISGTGEVKNKKLIQQILVLYKKYDVKFLHINSHTTYTGFFYDGNGVADKLAGGEM